jgi:type II secretory ATPase GspE/PulE/Tfp pilus assembly ATPase PilB-like protein
MRRLCERCKAPYEATAADVALLNREGTLQLDGPIYRAVGCSQCGKTGYRGRFGVHEILLVTEEIRGLVADHAHADELNKSAVASGMLTLREAGAANVARGYTTIEELLRVVA